MTEDSLVGKYLEISGALVAEIVAEEKDTLLVREAHADFELTTNSNNEIIGSEISHVMLTDKAVYLDKKVLDNYWVKTTELPAVPKTVNVCDSVVLINKLFRM